MARMFPREAELVAEQQVSQGRKSVKRFEWSNGLDTTLYKNIPLTVIIRHIHPPLRLLDLNTNNRPSEEDQGHGN